MPSSEGTTEARSRWLAEGVSEAELAELETLAPLSSWWIEWESTLGKEERGRRLPDKQGPGREPGHFITRVRCPKCGLESTYDLDAVTDFHCDDDSDCGYDFVDGAEGLKPLPGSF